MTHQRLFILVSKYRLSVITQFSPFDNIDYDFCYSSGARTLRERKIPSHTDNNAPVTEDNYPIFFLHSIANEKEYHYSTS